MPKPDLVAMRGASRGKVKEARCEFSIVSKGGFREMGLAGSEGGGALGWAGLATVF